MSKKHFHRWTCDDVLEGVAAQVVTLSTVVYPLPLLARNPTYASHPIFLAAAGGGAGQQEGTLPKPGGIGQRGVEALETLLTRVVLRPKQELRDRAMEVVGRVKEKAEEWGRGHPRENQVVGGAPPPVRIVGIHARTYFMKAVSTDTVSRRGGEGRRCGVAFPCVGVRGYNRAELGRKKSLVCGPSSRYVMRGEQGTRSRFFQEVVGAHLACRPIELGGGMHSPEFFCRPSSELVRDACDA